VIQFAVTLVLLVIAAAGLVHDSGDGPTLPSARSDAIAASLRCPTCNGLSVKDSTSPMAGSMREIIDEQVAAGRSDEQIRAHFVDRYSDWVLLQPPASGGGWLIWVVPVLVAIVGLVLVLVLAGRLRLPRFAGWGAVLVGIGMVLVLALQVNTGDRASGGLVTGATPVPGASGGDRDTSDPPEEAPGARATQQRIERLQEKVEADPDDAGLRLSLAAEALTVGRSAVVRTNSQAVLEEQPRNVDALLLRSLSVAGEDDADGRRAVQRYLETAPPEHPDREAVEGMAEQLGVGASDD